MERSIDQHEIRRPNIRSSTMTHINKWREAWNVCYDVVSECPHFNLKNFHRIFDQWVPALNMIFDKVIPNLSRYTPYFYYSYEPKGPKEIIQLYFEEQPLEDKIIVHIVFNVHEFCNIQKQYCENMNRLNQMLVNEARGTINIINQTENEMSPAEYFQLMTTWHLLFIFTLHALAHWDTFDKYEHAHYDTHMIVRDSVFFKLYYQGTLPTHSK